MLSARQQHCLNGIGIAAWQTRPPATILDAGGSVIDSIVESTVERRPPPPPLQTNTPTPAIPPTPAVAQSLQLDNWSQIEAAIEACHNCELASACARKLPGQGLQQADLMIIGEAPGHDEEIQGQPFAGRPGLLLDKMLQSIQLSRQSVFITHIVKCRTPDNRDPSRQEVEACSALLQAQIRLVQPRVVLSLGRISAQNLLLDKSPLNQLRGKPHTLPGSQLPLLVSYHPSYLLRNPQQKAMAWEDLKTLRRLIQHAAD